MQNKTILSWSGGKDSALALYELKRQENIEIAALLTTVTEGYDRISMHGVRRDLLVAQAAAVGYPLEEVTIPPLNDPSEPRTAQLNLPFSTDMSWEHLKVNSLP